jgi:DNA invertase Pin-like site-specific DNA recombinase
MSGLQKADSKDTVMVRGQKRFVAYYRVSTAKQGASGLGLEAQRAAVEGFVAGLTGKVEADFVEIESGKRDDRPKLAEAFGRARALKATLLIAKLDRLSRDAAFLLGLQKAEVDFVAVDMPDANRLTVGIMALIAQHEREMISARTIAALAAAKARGVKLGNPNGGAHLKDQWIKGQPAAVAAIAEQTKARRADLAPILTELEAEGITSANAKAATLNARGIPTARGGKWTARSVINATKAA